MLTIPPRFSRTIDGEICPIVAQTKLIYNQNDGTLSFQDPEGDLLYFEVVGNPPKMVTRHFLGKSFNEHMIRGLIKHIAGSYGLSGEVYKVEGSLATLQTYEIRG